jgi:predicted Zn-dependent peptidase
MSEPEHRVSTLQSGLRVITERMPTVRSVALGFCVGTGSAMEPDARAGISHLLEHMLFRGTDRFGSEEIDQIFDGMGAELNAETDRESTTLFTRVLDRHLERAFEVLGEMVWSPRFEQLEAERQVVLEEIAMYEDDPQERVFDVLGEAIFGSHPLGRAVIGSAQTVGAIELDDLRSYHRERYQPASVVIAAAGSVDHDELVAMAGRIEIRSHDRGSVDGLGDSAPLERFQRRVRFIPKETEQYHVCLGGIGIARNDERRFALRVLEGVLGGTASSRLFQEVRERRGLAYSIFCFSNLYRLGGEVGIYVGTRPEGLHEAIAAIASELERFIADPADERELIRSRENLKGKVALSLESTGARMGRLGAALLGGLPILSLEEMIERIDAVDVAALRTLASGLFDPRALSVCGIGPDEGTFLEALEPLGDLAPVRAAGGQV